MNLTLIALPHMPVDLAPLAAAYARLLREPPSDRREEQLSAIVLEVPPSQRAELKYMRTILDNRLGEVGL